MEEKLRNSQQAFISKVISHTTHEFKNHLAIINESAGLMGDLLSMEKGAGIANLERYQKIIKSINDRVAMSAEVTLKLNHFGHRMDFPLSSFNVNEVLEEELKLLGRYAEQKQVELSTDFEPEIPSIYNHTSIFQYMVFTCFEYLISRFDGPSRIVISTVVRGVAVRLEFFAKGTVRQGTDGLFDTLIQECSYGLGKMQSELTSEKPEDSSEKLIFLLRSLSPNSPDDN